MVFRGHVARFRFDRMMVHVTCRKKKKKEEIIGSDFFFNTRCVYFYNILRSFFFLLRILRIKIYLFTNMRGQSSIDISNYSIEIFLYLIIINNKFLIIVIISYIVLYSVSFSLISSVVKWLSGNLNGNSYTINASNKN